MRLIIAPGNFSGKHVILVIDAFYSVYFDCILNEK